MTIAPERPDIEELPDHIFDVWPGDIPAPEELFIPEHSAVIISVEFEFHCCSPSRGRLLHSLREEMEKSLPPVTYHRWDPPGKELELYRGPR